MSVDHLPPKRSSAALRDAKLLGYDQYIDKQIHSTRRLVKLVDIATVLTLLATSVLMFLLAAAVVEHWIWPGGFGGFVRAILFMMLVGGGGYYAVRRLLPLVVRSINPVYAAQTIERSSPALKNSLLNLLLFRQRREDLTDAVYATLEEQAAQRLVRVPIDSAVDRGHLIRLGYVLVAVVTVCALYKILSPKDPLITAERVLAPWADIVPPSRVAITAVEPGTTTLARDELLEVSADVHGIGEDDPVVIRYTTEDRQAVDQAVQMSPSAAGLRFTGKLPAAQAGAPLGVAQNLRYRIEAGDARSKEYKVTVVAAPTITVESVDYDYPEYTGFADRSVDALGDLRAIEGTRVTIHARANEPIEEAFVDFEADGRNDVQMNVDGEEARTAFLLTLRDDRQTPRYKSYVLRFTGVDGRRNREPVKFAIDTLPDYGPEVAVLAPQEKARDVRLDETIAIEVEARDPDFALANVRVHGDVSGHTVFDAPLLADSHTGKFTGRFLLTPNQQNLKPGDIVRYWAVARDNRAPDANEAVTEPRTLRIASQDPNQPPPDRVAQRDRNQPRPRDQREPQKNEPQDGQQQPGDSSAGGESGSQGKGEQGKNGKPQSGGEPASSDRNQAQNEENSNGTADSSQGEQQNEQSDQQQPGGAGDKSSQQQKQDGKKGQPSQGNESGGQPSGSDQSGAQSQGNRQGQDASGQQKSADRPSDGKSSSNGQRSPGQGSQRTGREQTKPEPSSPVSPEGDNDGEAFERIQKFLEHKGELPKDGQSKGEQGKQAPSNDQQGDQKGETKDERGQNQNGQSSNGSKQDKPTGKPAGSEANPSSEPSTSQRQAADNNNKQDDKNSSQLGKQANKPAESSEGKKTEQGEPTNQNKAQGEPASQQQQDGQPGSKNENRDRNSGAKSKPGESGQKQDGKSDQAGKQSDKPDGKQSTSDQQTSSKGSGGAGQQPQKDQPSPQSSPTANPGEKPQQRPSDNKSSENSEPPSGGHGKKQNDSQGEQGGDHTGGGKQGEGQKSPHDGTGSTGQNQSADQGDGESSEEGTGQKSQSDGKNAPSKDRTGQSGGKDPGQGSAQREGQGQQPGGKEPVGRNEPSDAKGDSKSPDPNQQPGGESASADGKPGTSDATRKNEQQPTNDKSQNPNTTAGGTPDGSGTGVPTGAGEPNHSAGPMPEGDAANLEYARKQTDLVVETLAEQLKRHKVDKRLLDELGWSEQDLNRFIERWQQLRSAARGNGPDADAAQRELDDALRSLGLRPGALQQSKATRDKIRDLREGYRGPVPLEYQERLRAYNQGVSRAKQDSE